MSEWRKRENSTLLLLLQHGIRQSTEMGARNMQMVEEGDGNVLVVDEGGYHSATMERSAGFRRCSE